MRSIDHVRSVVRLESLVALICVVIAIAGSRANAEDIGPAYRYQPIAIEHVDIWPMTTSNELEKDVTVLIKDGRIEKIAPAADVTVPRDVKVIDGRGKWLMPSLTDMHVHMESARMLRLITGNSNITPAMVTSADLALPYVANGVLQVLNPGAEAELLGLRDEIEAGQVLGPHMELSALVDGSPPIWPVGISYVATTPEDGRQFVRDVKAAGYDFVKTYSRLDFDTFSAIVDEARKQNVRVIGHIPGRGLDETEKWFQPGYEMVMHAEEYAFQTKDADHWVDNIPRYVALAKRTGVLLCSTLTLDERILQQMQNPTSLKTRSEIRYVNPATRFFWTNHSPYANAPPARIERIAKLVAFNAKLVKAFSDAGLPVFPGTDTTVPGMVAGFALHDEFDSQEAAGLTPSQILTADTRLAAQFLRTDADRGTVEVGKRADLLLLGANPMANVANTRDIAAVIASGRYLSRRELDKMMSDLARRYAAMPPIKDSNSPGNRSGGGGHFPDDDE
jgi:hypothetical protein